MGRAQNARPAPRIALAAMGGTWLAGWVLPDTGPLPLVGIVASIAAAMWVEERWFRAGAGRGTFYRVLRAAAFGALAPFAGVIPAVFAGPALGPGLAIGALWASSAALGSIIVLLVQAVAQTVASRFATWVRVTVLGVVLVAVSAVFVSSMVIPELVTLAGGDLEMRDDDGNPLPAEQWPEVAAELGLPEWVGRRDPADLAGHIVGLSILTMLVPALWSAVAKLGDAAMERIEPLDHAMERVASGDLTARVEVGGAVELARLATQFNGMVEALALARQMEHAFGAYVSAPVLERIRAQHGHFELPAVSREATVFFADMRGFTSMGERLPPALVLEVLQRFYRAALDVIAAHEGYVNDFMGDAMYVVFNAPLDQPDHVERAVRCARALQAEVERLNAAGLFPEVGELRIGVGVATGPVVTGNVGSARATQFAVLGDTVNLAARLCALAPPGEVWISALTAERLPAEIQRSPLDPVQVKGKAEPVRPHRVA